MDKLSIALCDDDSAFRALLRPAVEQAFLRCGVSAAVIEADSAETLERLLDHMSFDLILLDIDMPGTDGIRFGELLRSRGMEADIIYISNMEDRVYDIFRVHPWSFIRKSRYAGELDAVANEYVRSRRARIGTILIQGEDGSTVSLSPPSLIYVEGAGKLQKLFLCDRTEPLSARSSLRELESALTPHGFIRIHKGFLVNYRFIRRITSRSAILDSGMALPVGRDRLGSAREQYLTLMRWKGLSRTL